MSLHFAVSILHVAIQQPLYFQDSAAEETLLTSQTTSFFGGYDRSRSPSERKSQRNQAVNKSVKNFEQLRIAY